MNLRLRRETALDLTLEGSVGSFKVGSGGARSLEVKYLLTHVGLNFSAASNDKLLSALEPVREVFDFKSLDFDEIMQRDIDDARVSAELIPYLLDEDSHDMIKLFPPIVIVVMPIKLGRVQPERLFPKVTRSSPPPVDENDHQRLLITSGPTGNEVFEFEQPLIDGQPVMHDLVRLRLNTQRSKLVIVDGQHRAMALLALYRNLKDKWTDERRLPFREYYSVWTKNFIESFNLEEINLPVLLCVVPELDESYAGDFDMKKAARSIFLTLNKTARQVSDSRNKLLDDNDLISVFMRRTLSQVKNKDERSPHAFRIVNVELDQDGSRQKIQTPVAITGVPHVYYMIEHMMLDPGGTVKGVKPRSGTFYNRTRLDDLLDRLDGRNLLGAAVSESIRRYSFTGDAASILGVEFDKWFGSLILAMFEGFEPYERHNRAVIEISEYLERENDRQLKPILLEGQGIGRVFEAHRNNLHQWLDNGYFKTDVPEIEAIAGRLDATADRITATVSRLQAERARRYFSDLDDKSLIQDAASEIDPRITDFVNRLFSDVICTVAFQTAMICGFLGLFEKMSTRVNKGEFGNQEPADRQVLFEEYIGQLNRFFIPVKSSDLRALIRVFRGEVSDSGELWPVRPSPRTFREVVFRSEMQPDQWPKYRYLLLELWKPGDMPMMSVVREERDVCRGEVFSALHDHYETAFCLRTGKLKDEMTPDDRVSVFEEAFGHFGGLLHNLGAEALDHEQMHAAVSQVPAASATDPESDDTAPDMLEA